MFHVVWSESKMRIWTFICVVLSLSTLCCGYIITTPRRWTAGEDSQVCVTLSKPATLDEIITFEMEEIFHSSMNVLVQQNIVVPQGIQSICQKFALPWTKADFAEFTIVGSLEGQTLNHRRHVKIATNVFKTFIQTDKYLYKASETVQFRILTLTGPYLQVSIETDKEIWIENPSGTRLERWINVSNDFGLIHLSFQLSNEPEKGTYKIIVQSLHEKNFEHSFEVNEYVLPRFEVTINCASKVLATTEMIILEVCAKYTFGQPVKGNVFLNVSSNDGREFYRTTDNVFQIYGCQNYNITADDLYINIRNHSAKYLIINAVVTEEGTGVEIKANEKKIKIYRTVFSFQDISTQKYFKPELPYIGEVKATFSDGRSAPNELMEVCCRKSCKIMSTNADGILHFAIPPHLHYDISITALKYPSIKDIDSRHNIIKESSLSKSLKKYYSPFNSSLLIALSNKEPECTSTSESVDFELPVMFAVNKQESASVTVQVVSRGQIQFSKTFDQTFKTNSTLPIPESLFIKPIREPSTPGLIRGHFTVSISLPKTVSPKAQVLVWYASNEGMVVSDVRVISIMECLLNSVDITWSTDKAQPGTNAAVTITAEPFSLCSLGVFDKSVQLLSNNKNSLTMKKFLKLTKRATAASKYHTRRYLRKKRAVKSFAENATVHPSTLFTNSRKKRETLPTKLHSKRVRRDNRCHGVYNSDYVDASLMFRKAEVHVLSDLTLKTRPCVHFDEIAYYSGDRHVAHYLPPVNRIPEVEVEVESKRVFKKPKPRTYFPESWIWSIVTVRSNGSYRENFTLPDTVTEWVGRAVCVHPSKGVGVSNPATFITFKEFFVDLTLPPSVKRGEIFHVKISVFNYLNDSLPIRLILESPVDQFDILTDSGSSGGSGVRDTCVPVRDKTVVSIRIRAKEVGDVNISVKAEVQANAVDDCGSGNAQQRTDFLVKSIRVSFEGLLKEETRSKYVCSNESVSESWSVDTPYLIVPNSARGFVAIVGDVMGPTLENLGKLIRMPFGCGEQNMLNFAPNIFIMQYLDSTNENTANVANKAVEFMEKGYKRELKYRHRDGSFSAFGESDKSGSTWLTAFVLKSFAQARPYIKVEPNDLNVSKEWLKSKQLKNGCFESVGKVLHKGMKGGLSGLDSPSLLSAFVLIALIEAGESVNSIYVVEALYCIKSAAPTGNPYSLAVKTYALALAKSLDTQATLDQLLNHANISDDTMYWQLSDQHESSLGAAVETASYALLALLTITVNSAHPKLNYYLPQISSIVKWINTQRNGQGGFISTQDTIIALQALASFEKTYSQGPVDLSVTTIMMGNDDKISFGVSEKNKLLQQTMEFPVPIDTYVPTYIEFLIVGQGCVLLQSVLRYNVQETVINEAFNLVVKTTTEPDKGCKTKRIEACASYLLSDHVSNMAIIEIDLISGYIPEKADLKQIVADGKNLFKRYEVDGSIVTLYIDEFSAEEICLSFRILREVDVENPKRGTVKLYDYYKPEYQVNKVYTLPSPTECVDKV